MPKVHNYSAGPCILPEEVLQKAAASVINFNHLNLSLLEISHRSKDFEAVMDNARALVKELLGVPDGYTVLFLQGGASLGFLMTAYNMFSQKKKACYINTGTWATNAIQEAQFVGDVNVIASSEDKNFNYIPKNYTIDPDADYLHITTNNTIFGTQFKSTPKSPIPLVADMSSDIFSKKINVADYDLIYAGAQKNMGPAGATLYIVKEEIFKRNRIAMPSMLDLKIHHKKDSMFNTPPVYPIYVSMLTLEWLKKNGGIPWIENINNQKAELLYNEIDRNPLFKGTVETEDRSYMNACFLLNDESHQAEFDKMWKAANISGIKGHRSVGGYRASMYNALALESVQVLVDVMKNLESKVG